MVENKWLEMKVLNIDINIIIGIIYRHGKGKVDFFTVHSESLTENRSGYLYVEI